MKTGMEPSSFRHRFVIPVVIFLGIWLFSNVMLAIFEGKPDQLGGLDFYRPLMNIFSAIRFLFLLLGTLIIYPILYLRGASLKERFIGSYAVHMAYVIWAIVQASNFFPVGQAIYYGFNPVTIGTSFFQLGLICLAETGCRWYSRRRYGQPLSVIRWPSIVGLFVGLLAIYITLLWDGGVHWFYVYQELYKVIF